MSDCKNDLWILKFKTCSETDLKFDSEIRPVIGSGLDYANATNKPSINGVILEGNKTNEEILIGALSNSEIENLLKAAT